MSTEVRVIMIRENYQLLVLSIDMTMRILFQTVSDDTSGSGFFVVGNVEIKIVFVVTDSSGILEEGLANLQTFNELTESHPSEELLPSEAQ